MSIQLRLQVCRAISIRHLLERDGKANRGIVGVMHRTIFVVMLATHVMAADTGWRSATSAGPHSDWDNPENVYQNDDEYARGKWSRAVQDFGGFGFEIPAGALIDGIEVQARWARGTGQNVTLGIEISTDAGTSYTLTGNQDTSVAAAQRTVTFGGSSEKWGRSVWKSGDFTDARFRIRMEVTGTQGNQINAYWLQVNVHYTVLPPAVSNASGATDIGLTTAILHGETSGGIPAPDITIFWGPTNGGIEPVAWSNAVPLGAHDGAFSTIIEGLIANQTNYYRCFASNAAAAVWASESAVFSTLSPALTFEATHFQVPESGPAPVIGVRLDTPSAAPVSVGYRTVDGTATAGSDYLATEGWLTWEPGETGLKMFSVEISDDKTEELDEQFHIELYAPANAVIAPPTKAAVLILDDDGGATIRFAEAASGGLESQTNASVRVTITPVSDVDVTVDYAATDGTAIHEIDYVLTPASLTIPAGASEARIEFTVIDNTLDEPDKTVVISLSNPTRARLGQLSSHSYTILDDDASPPQVDNGHGAIRITSHSATLRGAILHTGGEDPAVFVCWDTAPGGETTGSWSRCEAVGVRGVGDFEWDVDQLVEGQTYYYRIIAINSGGVGYAERIEHFTANDPPSSELAFNAGMETQGQTSADAQHWARSNASGMRRQNVNPRTDSYAMEFDAEAGITLYGTEDNVLLLSWNGLIAGTDRSHPLGGIRPGFVLSGKGYTRTQGLLSPTRTPNQDQLEFRWSDVDSGMPWMSAALYHKEYTYQEHALTSPLPLPAEFTGRQYRPEMIRLSKANTNPGTFYADDLTLSASLPKLHLESDPANTVTFAQTTYNNHRDLALRARNAGGGEDTVLYGAFITGVEDLTSPSWDKTAWRIIGDPAGAFQIVSGAQLASTNDGPSYQACVIRFTPPAVGVYTSVVRVATTDPTAHYANSGVIFNSIVYYDYTLVAEAVHPTLSISSTTGGTVISPGEGVFQLEHGTVLDVSATPAVGYRFDKWTGTAVTAGKVANPDTATTTVTIHGDHTLIAHFALGLYTLTFNSAGGSTVAPITQAYGTVVTAPASPTREGYTFDGWTPAVPETMPAENLTLTAQWTASVTDPVSAQAVPNNPHSASRMDLGWSLNTQNHAVMIVRSTDGQFWNPVQDATYDVGYSSGNSTVIYKGTGTSFTDVQLLPRKTYAYRFYAYHDGTYSPGISRSHATMAPQACNSGVGAPQQPATVYLGDQDLIFGVESWEAIEGQHGDARLFIHRSPDLGSGLAGPLLGASAVTHREPRSPAFTETGVWYWGIQLAFGSYGNAFWYCRDTSSASETDAQPDASLTVDVLPLPPASNVRASAGADPGREVTLSWDNEAWDRDVLIVRRQQDAPEEPLQGTEYNLGDACGGGVVVYNGSDQSFPDQGLRGRTLYHYAIFNRNNGFYSTLLRVQVETGEPTPQGSTFRFR